MILILNFLNSITIIMLSFAIGGGLNIYLSKKNSYTHLYKTNLQETNTNTNYIGFSFFVFMVTKSFYSKLNTIIKFNGSSTTELDKMRKEMINSEVGHLIGLIAAQLIFLILFISKVKVFWLPTGLSFLCIGTIMNIFHNLYPIILQRKNRQRIDEILTHKRTFVKI